MPVARLPWPKSAIPAKTPDAGARGVICPRGSPREGAQKLIAPRRAAQTGNGGTASGEPATRQLPRPARLTS